MVFIEERRFQINPRLPESLNPPLTFREILSKFRSDTLASTVFSDNSEVLEGIEALYSQIDDEYAYHERYGKDPGKYNLALEPQDRRALNTVFYQLVPDPVRDLVDKQSSESGTIELYRSRLPLGRDYSYWERIQLSDGLSRVSILGYKEVEETLPQDDIM